MKCSITKCKCQSKTMANSLSETLKINNQKRDSMKEFCRLCLDHKGPFVNMHTTQYLILGLQDKIEAICNIQINNGAKLPTICKMCVDQVLSMSNFRNMSIYADELLRTYYSEIIQTYPKLLIQLQKQLVNLNLPTTTTSKGVSAEVRSENSLKNNKTTNQSNKSSELIDNSNIDIDIKQEHIDEDEIIDQFNDDLFCVNFEFLDGAKIKEEDMVNLNDEILKNENLSINGNENTNIDNQNSNIEKDLFENEVVQREDEEVKIKEEDVTKDDESAISDYLDNSPDITNVFDIENEIQRLARELEIKEEDIVVLNDSRLIGVNNQYIINIMKQGSNEKNSFLNETPQDFSIFSEITNSQEIDPLQIDETEYNFETATKENVSNNHHAAIADAGPLPFEYINNTHLNNKRRVMKQTNTNVPHKHIVNIKKPRRKKRISKHLEEFRLELLPTIIHAQHKYENKRRASAPINNNILSKTDGITHEAPLEICPKPGFVQRPGRIPNEIYDNVTDFDDIPCTVIEKPPVGELTDLEVSQRALTNDHQYHLYEYPDEQKIYTRKMPPLITIQKKDNTVNQAVIINKVTQNTIPQAIPASDIYNLKVTATNNIIHNETTFDPNEINASYVLELADDDPFFEHFQNLQNSSSNLPSSNARGSTQIDTSKSGEPRISFNNSVQMPQKRTNRFVTKPAEFSKLISLENKAVSLDKVYLNQFNNFEKQFNTNLNRTVVNKNQINNISNPSTSKTVPKIVLTRCDNIINSKSSRKSRKAPTDSVQNTRLPVTNVVANERILGNIPKSFNQNLKAGAINRCPKKYRNILPQPPSLPVPQLPSLPVPQPPSLPVPQPPSLSVLQPSATLFTGQAIEVASMPQSCYLTTFINTDPKLAEIAESVKMSGEIVEYLINLSEQEENTEHTQLYTGESDINLERNISYYTQQYIELCKLGLLPMPQHTGYVDDPEPIPGSSTMPKTPPTTVETRQSYPLSQNCQSGPQNKCSSCKNPNCLFSIQNTLYKCKDCDRIFYSIPNLKQHFVKTHLNPNAFQCKKCQKTFISELDLKAHMILLSNIRRYPCRICGIKYKYKRCLRKHLLSHNGIKKYRCNYCRKSFVLKKLLTHHVTQHNKTVKSIPCGVCGKLFNTIKSCKLHEKTHEPVALFSCALCSLEFISRSEYKSHNQIHYPYIYPRDQNTISCNNCRKSFNRMDSLLAHKLIHPQTRKYQCYLCQSSFLTNSGLMHHFRRHYGQTLPCYVCNKPIQSNKLKKHIRRHLDLPRFECRLCDQTFNDVNLYVLHEQSHSKIKIKYECTFCRKSFKNEKYYKIHVFNYHRVKLSNMELQYFESKLSCSTHLRQFNTYKSKVHKNVYITNTV